MKRLFYLVTFILAGGALLQAIHPGSSQSFLFSNLAYSHEKPGP